MQTFDFVVIGGGSAGYSAASAAAKSGLKTVCLEGGEQVGGLCILRGCMPSKAFIESANRFLTLRRANEFGLSAGHIAYDSAAIVERKQELVGIFQKHRGEQLTEGKFAFIRGRGQFTDQHHLRIKLRDGGEQEIEGKTFLIASGSVINFIDLPGLKEAGFLDSDTALSCERFPRSLIVLGGGAIALEFAHFYGALGVEVTVLQRSNQVIKEADPDVAEALVTAFEKRGIKVICGTKLRRVERTADGKRVWYERDGVEEMLEAEEILYALGRRPAVDGLGLKEAGVEIDEDNNCSVIVNPSLQTSRRHIFAAGDVTGLFEVVHIGIQQGEMAALNAKRLLEDKDLAKIDYRLKMFVMFPEPQIAMVGLTEREAAEQGLDVRVACHPFHDHGKSILRGEVEGFVKLIVDARNGEILGGAVIGPEASDLIQEITVAMSFHATAATLAAIPHYHPTLNEIWTYPAEELAHLDTRSR
jgi:pyruvate/2-oxoglutarate dehydrogenase complex dihydrolipoamide dehydrogenase (E3) component